MQFTAPVISLFIITSAATAAQTASITAILEGTVSDNTGGVIPDAEVRLRNTATNQVRTVRANEQGFFRASELPVGTYEISVEHSGFALYQHTEITLAIGQTIRFNIELAPEGAASQVTITERPPPIDASQTALRTTIDTEKIEELPVRSRNYLNFVLLAPGVAPSNQQQTASAQTQLADSGFTFGGLRARSNNLSVDGLDNNDEYTGSSRTELSLEIVREFQVVNNGLSAEFGGASGGSINVITRTGTNEVHGDAFLFQAVVSAATASEELALQRHRAKKMEQAIDAWLTDPEDPDSFTLAPRANEIPVVYIENGDDGKPKRKKALLSTLPARIEEQSGITVSHVLLPTSLFRVICFYNKASYVDYVRLQTQ